MRTLTDAERATAMAMRDEKTPWRSIGRRLHIDPAAIKTALVAHGYQIDCRPKTTQGKKQRAYDLYMETLPGGTKRPITVVARMLNVRRKSIRRWVKELGGELRPYQHQRQMDAEPMKPQTGPAPAGWRAMATCSIGHSETATLAEEGSLYCANLCDWHDCTRPAHWVPCEAVTDGICGLPPDADGERCAWYLSKCDQDATPADLDAFKRFKAERKAKARLIAADARRARAHRKAETEGTSLYWAAVRRDKARMEER